MTDSSRASADPFASTPVIGKLSPSDAAAKLREVGEHDAAGAIEQAALGGERAAITLSDAADWWPFKDKPWQHTAHAFGYLGQMQPGAQQLAIQSAGSIAPDASLKGGRIKITLDRLRIAAYPGGGTHRVLFDFFAQNQAPGNVEQLHFNATYRVHEGEQAGVTGYPIFVGLNVATDGVAFRCFTVNVQNDDDEGFLQFLDSDVFKSGLKIVTTVQPALAPLSGIAVGITRAIAGRNRNVPVQDFYLGLDFTNIATGARLAEGSYVAVQIPETYQSVWDWKDWIFNPSSGQLVNATNPTQLIPYNYLVLGVSRYEGD